MKSLGRVRLVATPWTAAHQAPLSMGFSRRECWSGMPLPSPYVGFGLRITVRNRKCGHFSGSQLQASTARSTSRIPGRGTKTPHATQHSQNNNCRSLVFTFMKVWPQGWTLLGLDSTQGLIWSSTVSGSQDPSNLSLCWALPSSSGPLHGLRWLLHDLPSHPLSSLEEGGKRKRKPYF